MKINLLLTSFFCILLTGQVTGQITGFKISNQVSSIKEDEKVSITKSGESKQVFKTLEIIQFNYLTLTRKSKEEELNKIETELYNNSMANDGQDRFDDETIKSKSERITTLKNEIRHIESEQDSLYYSYTKDYMKFDNFMALSFGPIRSRAFFDMLYSNEGKQFKALGSAGINFGNNTGSIYSELASGNLGLFRVSLGTMISSNNNTNEVEGKKEEAYQRLITYGGNTVLNLEYPLVYAHSNNNQYNFISRFIAKGTADLPAFGTNTEKWAGSSSFGLDFYADAATSNNSLRFFLNLNASKIYGTDVFKDNLGTENANFTFGQLTMGLIFLENFKISFVVSTFSSESELRNRNIVAGGQVLR
ncbi:MAG TPA: hypothetical protein VKX34_10510 [Aequorivita sp.]|nr:hypothetical protein [Aequorivita sp.]